MVIRKPKSKKAPAAGRKFFKKKKCRFCADRMGVIDYKNVERLIKCITDQGKIVPRRISGACASHQRSLAQAIKKARFAAILPYVSH